MPAAVMPWVRHQFFDNNGAPLASGTLEFYESGGSTPLAVYSDTDLSVSAGTTVTLNSAGFPQVSGSEVALYLLPQAYRVVVKNSSGTTLRTVDNVYALQSASSSNVDISTAVAGEALSTNDVVYLADGSGSTTAGRWYKTDSDNTYASSSAGMTGVATAAIASGATGTVRIHGRITGLSSLTAGELYYASATAGGLTATPPTNARLIGQADSTTSLVLMANAGVRLPDSDGTHFLVLRTSSNLTADRILALVTGDAARTLTFNGDAILPWDPLNIAEGRLTLTTATPVTTADVTAATTIYYALYKGNRIALYDGSAAWNVRTFSELSIAVPATTSTMYDVFIYDNSGTPTLELTAWTNDTTRATALTTQNGVLVKTGATTRRYVGSCRTTGVSGQTEDSVSKRYVWNYYNRVLRTLSVTDGTDSWSYGTAAYQQANASTANQVDLVVGVAESRLRLTLMAQYEHATAGNRASVAIGQDGLTAIASQRLSDGTVAANNARAIGIAEVVLYPAVGRHYYTWLENALAGTAYTFYGDAGASTQVQSGMFGDYEG